MASTKDKGDKYELEVLKEIDNLLESGDLPFPKNLVTVRHKHKYKASAGNEIEVDISLEITRPGAQTYSQLVLIECKDYKTAISTLRYNDLAKKLKYLHAHKGYIFTTSSFQKGVIQQGLLDHIGLVRFIPGTKPIFDAERSGLTPRDLYFQELNSPTEDTTSFISLESREAYTDFASFFFRQLLGIEEDSIVPFLSDEKISKFAATVRSLIGSTDVIALSDLDLIKMVSSVAKYSITTMNLNKNTLGICAFKDKQIIINSDLEIGSPRWRFTIAHELGHALIHKQLFRKGFCSILADSDENYLTTSSKKRMEIQANIFASYLLMPTSQFSTVFLNCRKQLGIPQRHYPKIYVDNQPVNLNDYYGIIESVSKAFKVSHQVVEIRMSHLGLIIDNRANHTISFL